MNSQSSSGEIPKGQLSRGRGRPRKWPNSTVANTIVSPTTKQEIARVVLSRGRGRPQKRPATIVSMTTKQQPMQSVLVLPSSSSPDVTQRSDSGSIRPLAVAGKTATVLGKTSTRLEKPSPLVKVRCPAVSLVRQSGQSKLVVVKTSSAAQPVKPASSGQDASASCLLATAVMSSISSWPTASAARVVIVRSSSSSKSTCAAAASVVRSCAGGVVVSVKKLSPAVPVVMKSTAGLTSAQPRLAPVVKLPALCRPGHHGSAVTVLPPPPQSNATLHDSWRLPAISATAGHQHITHMMRFTQFS